jgi:hypothetical protein
MKEMHMEETRKTVRKPRGAAAPRPATGKSPPQAKSSTRKSAAQPAAPDRAPSPMQREEMVRTAAYFRAQQRGFKPGCEWEDWLAAEAEVTALLGAPRAPKGRKAPVRKTRPG